MIYLRPITEPQAGRVAVLGHTTGSHLGLTEKEERKVTVIWLAEVADGRVRCWRLLEDTPDRRREFGFCLTA